MIAGPQRGDVGPEAVADRVLVAPLHQQAFIWGVSARVEQPAAGLIEAIPTPVPSKT